MGYVEIELQMQYHTHYYGYFVVCIVTLAGVLYKATVLVDVKNNVIVDKPSYLISADL